MSSSLVLGSVGELLPEEPKEPGVHLLAGYDLGSPEEVTAAVEALLIDGERVVATRTGNRSFVLPLLVIGEDRQDLTARVDELLLALTAADYTLTWTPEGGLPLVWDCFPARSTPTWDTAVEDLAFAQVIDVTIPALPFGRSPDSEDATLTEVGAGTNGKLFALTDLLGSAPAPVAVELAFGGPVDAWLLHLPPAGADPDAPILNPFPDTDQTVTVANAQRLRGTYTIVAGVTTYGTPGQLRTMDVTVEQDGTGVTETIQKAYTSGLNLRPIELGNITLPLVDRPAGATSSLTFTFDDSGATTLHTLMLIDTAGQLVASLSQAGTLGNTLAAWVDEPAPGAVLGPVWNSPTEMRTGAYAVAEPRVTGGALAVSTKHEGLPLLVFSAGDNPDAPAVTYRPRWLAERVA